DRRSPSRSLTLFLFLLRRLGRADRGDRRPRRRIAGRERVLRSPVDDVALFGLAGLLLALLLALGHVFARASRFLRLSGHHKILSEKGSGRGQVTMSLPGWARQQPPSGTFHGHKNKMQAPCQTEPNGSSADGDGG